MTPNALPPVGPHGGDARVVAAALGLEPDAVLDLSQSLNPVAPDPGPVVARHLGALGRYPDPASATAALAAAMSVDPARLLLTNGGSEAIHLVAGEVGGRVVEPEFSLHPRGSGPLWRSNPHNPSGRLAPSGARADVWDEAFYALATGRWTRGDSGSIVVGSLTKLLACPGLRIGYVLAPADDPDLVRRCRLRQPAWSVNGLVAAALPDLLDQVRLAQWSAQVAVLRRQLVALLAHHGLTALPSDANWVLVEAPGLREGLARRGVVVRDCATFGLPGTLRIAVPSAGGLEVLGAALAGARPRPVGATGGAGSGAAGVETSFRPDRVGAHPTSPPPMTPTPATALTPPTALTAPTPTTPTATTPPTAMTPTTPTTPTTDARRKG